MQAAGECSITLLKREGREVPSVVATITRAPTDVPAQTPELALALAIFGVLTNDQRQQVEHSLRRMKADDNRPAQLAYNLLYERI